MLKYFLFFITLVNSVYCNVTGFKFTEKGLQLQNLSFHSIKDKYEENHSWEVFKYKKKWCIPFESLSDLKAIKFGAIDGHDINKPIGIIMKVFIPVGIKLKQAEFFYSSKYIQSNQTPKIVDLNGLKRGKWVDFKIWLPNYKISIGYSWFDILFFAPETYKENKVKQNLSDLFASEDVLIHSFKVVSSKVNPIISLKKYRKLYPSMFEKTEGVLLLLILIISLFLISLFGFNKFVGIKIYLTFLFPFIAILIYFSFFGVSFLDSIEINELKKLETKLSDTLSSGKTIWAQAELDQQKLIEIIKDEFKIAVDSKYKNKSFKKKLKANISPKEIHNEADKISKKYNISFMIVNGKSRKKSFDFVGPEQITKRRWKNLVMTIYPLLRLFTRKKYQTSYWFYDALGSQLNDVFEAQNYATDLLDEVLDIDSFIYSPKRLSSVSFLDFDMERMFEVSKEKRLFWTYFSDENIKPDRVLWLILGFCEEPLLLKLLKVRFVEYFKIKRKQFGSNLEYIFIGRNEQTSFPIVNESKGEFLQASALSQTYKHKTSFIKFENNIPFYYVSDIYSPLPSYNLAFRVDMTSLLKRVQIKKNQIYWISLFILFVLMLLTYLLSQKVLQPLRRLKQSFLKIDKEEFDFKLDVTRTDQYGHVINKFNDMLMTLKEKKFMSSFVSRMAITAIKKKETTKKELVTVLYCGIKNINAIRDKEGHHNGLQSINEVICLIQDCVVENSGFIDKFTGNASLALFRHKARYNCPFKAALLVREKLANLNNSRKREGKIEILLGLGLATGPVILGHIGAQKRKDFTCIGNTVNMAARLGSKFYGDSYVGIFIQMDADTCDIQLDQKFYSVTRLDDISIKGKNKKQVVYVLD
ncbi:MAG: hypothetical protein COB02_12800 [Candidatus Cloacimonadota bacterium]|nr:MAG: hypothetical protein COB02_12800 [Candidatus Cloacimonadota bacterium]